MPFRRRFRTWTQTRPFQPLCGWLISLCRFATKSISIKQFQHPHHSFDLARMFRLQTGRRLGPSSLKLPPSSCSSHIVRVPTTANPTKKKNQTTTENQTENKHNQPSEAAKSVLLFFTSRPPFTATKSSGK